MSEENFPVLLGAVAVLVLMLSIGATITGFVSLGNIGNGPDNPDTSNLDDLFSDNGEDTGTQDNGNNNGDDENDDGGEGDGEICAQVITEYYVLENNVCVSKQNSDSCIPSNGFLILDECEEEIVVQTCQSECSFGTKECTVNGLRECVDNDEDGCFEWETKSCGVGQKCVSNGQCVNLCSEDNWRFRLKPISCPSNEKQTKIWNKIGSCVDGIQKEKKEIVSCDYKAPECESDGFTYSAWSECTENNVQTRTISNKEPAGCAVLNADTSKSCVFIPNCVESNWDKFDSECRKEGKLTRTWTKVGECVDGIQKEKKEIVSCDYKAPECESDGFTYSAWSECKSGGYTERAVISKKPSDCIGGNPLVKEVCEYIPPCTENQIESCGSVNNGYFDGYKDICKTDESGWKGENTCKVVCNEEYERDGSKCVKKEIAENYEDEVDVNDVEIEEQEDNNIEDSEINEVKEDIKDDLNEGNIEIEDSERDEIIDEVEDILNDVVDKSTTQEEKNQVEKKIEDKVKEVLKNSTISQKEKEIVTQNVIEKVNKILESNKDTVVKKNGKIIIKFKNEKSLAELGNISIKTSLFGEEREYIIVRNLTLLKNESKTIYLEKKKLESNAVCFRDEKGIKEIGEILASCQKLACPGVLGRYTCAVNESSGEFIISGLRHSGVVEDALIKGDGICSPEIGESCASAPGDCGACPDVQTEPPRESKGSGGSRIGNTESSSEKNEQKNSEIDEEVITKNAKKDQSSVSGEENYSNAVSKIMEFVKNNLIWFIIGIIAFIAIVVLIVLFRVLGKDNEREVKGVYIRT